jgi:hypothetical protein
MSYTVSEIEHIERMKTYNKDMAHLNLAMELFERVIESNAIGANNIEGSIMMLLDDVRAKDETELATENNDLDALQSSIEHISNMKENGYNHLVNALMDEYKLFL